MRRSNAPCGVKYPTAEVLYTYYNRCITRVVNQTGRHERPVGAIADGLADLGASPGYRSALPGGHTSRTSPCSPIPDAARFGRPLGVVARASYLPRRPQPESTRANDPRPPTSGNCNLCSRSHTTETLSRGRSEPAFRLKLQTVLMASSCGSCRCLPCRPRCGSSPGPAAALPCEAGTGADHPSAPLEHRLSHGADLQPVQRAGLSRSSGVPSRDNP